MIARALEVLDAQFLRWIQEGRPECDTALCAASRALVRAVREERGAAWLLDVNSGVMWLWNGADPVRNFEATFVFPAHAPETERLALERRSGPYEGVKRDLELVAAIFLSARSEGGFLLNWS